MDYNPNSFNKKTKTPFIPSRRNCRHNCDKLSSADWLSYFNDPEYQNTPKFVEVRFKNTKKGFYKNSNNLRLEVGDIVAVESPTGYDIGLVSLSSDLVISKMKNKNLDENSENVLNVFRLAGSHDLHLWEEAKSIEYETLLKSREIAKELKLEMKINDIEYQGDKKKATFYYTAEGRVDFRELIKQYAKTFRIKVEMRQIGIRQEAGRLGGIADCGRELCCSTWLTDFNTVPTIAAKQQNLYMNPAKLSGQCGRLKCCLNYELDTYLEASNEFPEQEIVLKTKKGDAKVIKIDLLKGIMWFLMEGDNIETSPHALTISEVKKIIELNKRKIYPNDLSEFSKVEKNLNKNKTDNKYEEDYTFSPDK